MIKESLFELKKFQFLGTNELSFYDKKRWTFYWQSFFLTKILLLQEKKRFFVPINTLSQKSCSKKKTYIDWIIILKDIWSLENRFQVKKIVFCPKKKTLFSPVRKRFFNKCIEVFPSERIWSNKRFSHLQLSKIVRWSQFLPDNGWNIFEIKNYLHNFSFL